MAPADERVFHVTCDNQFEGDLSADALGITSCLYAYSNLSFADGDIAREYARQYHLLREYMMEHREVKAILGATD
ncbi:MAG: antirestriction protein [Pseudomonadota bacterium]